MSTRPAGEWRLLASASLSWALCAWSLFSPGRSTITGLIALVFGLVILAAFALKLKRAATIQHSRTSVLASVCLLPCASLVLIGAQIHIGEQARADPTFVTAAQNGTDITFDAQIAAFPQSQQSEIGERSWVRIETTGQRGNIPMLVWLSDIEAPKAALAPGVRVSITARLTAQAPESAAAYTANPTAFTTVSPQSPVADLGSTAASLRQEILRLAKEITGGELLPGFAIGDTSLVPEDLNHAMLESSLSHLTAVSGGNTGLVIAALIWAVARLGAGLRVRAIIAFLGLGMFVVVVGPDASVQRAAVMAAVLLVGSFGGNTRAALPALGFAILCLLAVDPWQSLQAGFALSVVATGGILLLAPPIAKWLRRTLLLPNALALTVSVALSAQLTCGPFLLLLQPGVPAVGVLANVLAAPAAPLATGLALLALLLGPLSAPVAIATLWVASIPARWIAAVAAVASTLPGGRWNWPGGWPGALLFAGCEAAVYLAWLLSAGRLGLPGGVRVAARAPWTQKTQAPFIIRIAIALLLSVATGVFTGFTLATPLAGKLGVPKNWVVVACDVGQGDAILVRDLERPDEIALIDTGKNPDELRDCLDTFDVKRIALLILTHDDLDHAGAYASVLNRVDRAIVSPAIAGEENRDRQLLRGLDKAEVPFRIVWSGERRLGDEAGPDWVILSPQLAPQPSSTNAASIAMLFDLGPARFLALGDTGKDEQARLLRQEVPQGGTVDIVKVAHHGSRNQEPALYKSVSANWGLISVGAHNGYGHPTDTTLSFLIESDTKPLRTDLHGSIAIVQLADGTLKPWLSRASPEPSNAAITKLFPAPLTRMSVRDTRLKAWQRHQNLAKRKSRRSTSTKRDLPPLY